MPTRTLSWPVSPKDNTLRLENALSSAQLSLLHAMADEATARSLPLYLVGGFVRDLLLHRPGLDFDLVVEGDAITLAYTLATKNGGKVTAHKHFGTAQWFLPESLGITRHSSLDLISARSESYPHSGALPVVRLGTLSDDLRRRDFTINTLALRLDGQHFGELRDDLGGLEDLEKGIVRVLHPNSYRDDPTRILRAVRYEQRYGFRIARKDLALIAEAKPLLGRLSGERLRHELDLMLAEEKAAAMLARLATLGILAEIHSSLAWDDSLRPVFEKLDQPEPDSWRGIQNLPRVPRRVALGYLIWLSATEAPAIKSLAARLDFTASLREALLASSALRRDLSSLVQARPSVVTALLDKVPPLAVCALSLELKSISSDKSVSVRLSVSESADTSVPVRLSASKSADPSAPVRLSASKSADESAPVRLSVSESADKSGPVRLSVSESADTSVPVRLSASKSADESVDNYLSLWRHVKTKTTGHTLKKLGLEPGPEFQRILRRLKNAWLDGEIHTVREEKALLEKLRESATRT